jgi:hypothetical protein
LKTLSLSLSLSSLTNGIPSASLQVLLMLLLVL